MAIVNPVVILRWQATSPFGVLSGEVDTRVGHGYRRKAVKKIKEEIRSGNPNRMGELWCISIVDETGETIYRGDHTV